MSSVSELIERARRDIAQATGPIQPSQVAGADVSLSKVRQHCFIRSLLFTRATYDWGYLSSWQVYEKFGEIFGFETSGSDVCCPTERMFCIFQQLQIPKDPTKAVEACWNYWQMARFFAQFSAQEQDEIVHKIMQLIQERPWKTSTNSLQQPVQT